MPSGHVKATVNGTTIAEADHYEFVEGNIYFPPDAIRSEYFQKTSHSTHCPWKGDASYYTIKVGGDSGTELENAAWYYPETYDKAAHIKDYVAFYKNKVDISGP
ncbi:uncharacterized protein B0I36DRAFT_360929 [Microdochium trichocladiopsis]|uniref:DUF427 domain-containing protein n=1 Tax=Microdochium trichocladiopsis TaxID=1682393 RepID=A0A9P8YC65_9PEZI|nr:uncharacterized protein B0I36DRAFT_360929 [Microdochium trichocladiopsis]KAH7035587.1 hypothetical protein B0I36DRAFT_360929 [Microdochium trichocladiopsis]